MPYLTKIAKIPWGAQSVFRQTKNITFFARLLGSTSEPGQDVPRSSVRDVATRSSGL